ncbi:O-antigen translocase [Aquimarina agarilytica]|uniref:O-antigen translocase n=1 Tax=Aquimarina agarilytica TaxID=1087449 RepID=UPI0002888825|nr:O-antigen translocase [Aquimarina agarilytica]
MPGIKNYTPNKQLLKVMSINSIAVLVRLVTGFILSKAIAIFIGPQGLGIIGNLRSFINSIQTIASLGFYNGVVKYVAEHKNNIKELSKILSTSYYLGFIAMLGTSMILYFFAPFWSSYVLNSSDYAHVIKILAAGISLMIVDYFCLAIINGFSRYKVYTILNITTTVFSLIVTVILLWQYRLEGMLYAIVITPALALFITLIIIFKQKSFVQLLKASNISWDYSKKLIEYSLMALLTAVIIPPTIIAIRNHIVDVEGLTQMGYWEAMNRISNYYLVFVTSLLSLYLFPKLSAVKTTKQFKQEIFSFYKTLMPLVIIGLLILYFFRVFFIKLLLTSEFLPMQRLFSWQLTGDFFRILSSVLAYQFMAKKMTKSYVFTEILSAVIWYFSSIYFINNYGYEGAAIGYLVCYSSYFFVLVIWFRKYFFTKE